MGKGPAALSLQSDVGLDDIGPNRGVKAYDVIVFAFGFTLKPEVLKVEVFLSDWSCQYDAESIGYWHEPMFLSQKRFNPAT